jgi:hypothetical protein
MQAIEQLRKWTKKVVAQFIGLDSNRITFNLAQQKSARDQADINMMPVDASKWAPLQNSAGQAYFMPGYDDPADITHPLR